MCTTGGLGRHIGRQWTDISVDYQSTIGRLSVGNRPTIGRLSTDSRPTVDRQSTYICTHLSAECRPIYRSTIGRQSTDYRSIVDRQLTDNRPIYRPMYRPICRPRPPIVHMIRYFKGWIASIQWFNSYSVDNCLIKCIALFTGQRFIQLIDIYPVNSNIHLLSNWGQMKNWV